MFTEFTVSINGEISAVVLRAVQIDQDCISQVDKRYKRTFVDINFDAWSDSQVVIGTLENHCTRTVQCSHRIWLQSTSAQNSVPSC